jgi:hypothetical protein
MTDIETTQNSTTTENPVTPEKQKKVSFEMVLPDINPILAWLNIEKSRIGLETFKLNSLFIEKDNRNRDKFTRLSNDFQIHQYEDYIYFMEFDLKEQTPENIAKRIFLTHKKGLELRCHYLFDMMSISEMNCDMCLSNMEQFEKLRKINSILLKELEKKYQKIQKSFDVSFTFEQMQEWKQHLEPITNHFQILKAEIDKNSQMLISGAVQYEQLKFARVINRHNYDQAMNYLNAFYPG